jgi:ABC-type amino acid transport substrate-binding protein
MGIKVVHTEIPFKRALDMVEKGRADVTLDLFEKGVPTIQFPKYPMSAIVGVVVFLKGKFKWEGEKTLLNQKAVWIRGYDIHKLVKTRMIWFEVNSIDQGISMIEKGREDFYIDERRAIQTYFDSHKDQAGKFQREELYTIHLFPGFAQTERASRYMRIYEKRVIEILKNGSMEKIFAKADRIEMFRALKKEIERRVKAKV